MPYCDDKQLALLLDRVEELCIRAEAGRFTHTDFLTPREAKHAAALVARRGQGHRARLYGGYACAERACLLLFPDYVADAYADGGGVAAADVSELLALAGEDDPVLAVRLEGSGYRSLTHRDYLGSLLSLGLERDVLGDIAMDGGGATVLCMARMQPFLLSHVERIGGDAVRVRATALGPDFDGGRRFIPVRDTVASARLDCVVAALACCSREQAQALVRDGRVEVDYEVEQRPDHALDAPTVITVRGEGKFILRELGGQTRKGRLRLLADRYD